MKERVIFDPFLAEEARRYLPLKSEVAVVVVPGLLLALVHSKMLSYLESCVLLALSNIFKIFRL